MVSSACSCVNLQRSLAVLHARMLVTDQNPWVSHRLTSTERMISWWIHQLLQKCLCHGSAPSVGSIMKSRQLHVCSVTRRGLQLQRSSHTHRVPARKLVTNSRQVCKSLEPMWSLVSRVWRD